MGHKKYLKTLTVSFLTFTSLAFIDGMTLREICETVISYGLGLTGTGIIIFTIGYLWHKEEPTVFNEEE